MRVQIIGLGNVGFTTALLLLNKNIDEIVLYDKDRTKTIYQYYELYTINKLVSGDCKLISADCIVNADVYVISAGLSRRDTSQTRESLYEENKKIIHEICEKIMFINQFAFIIIATNPPTELCKTCLEYVPRVIPAGLETDSIENSIIKKNKHEGYIIDVGDYVFSHKGYTVSVAGEIVKIIESLRF